MSQPYELEIELVEAEGDCVVGHTVGDTFTIPGHTDNFSCDGLCIHALYSMIEKLIALRYGASFPWVENEEEGVLHACPDAKNPHSFKITRIKE
ncbi:MAG: TIGR04076 family protein [Candidatus Acetothermia bacterium]